MTTMKRQPLLCLLGTSLLFGACLVNAAENSLFVKTKLLKSSSETRTIAADPTTASVEVMGINSNIIADSTPYLTVQLPGQTKEEKVWLSRFSKTERGMQVWRGRYNRNVLKNTPMASLKAADFDSVILVSIHEGRNRQVRRMFEAIGHQVVALKRVGFGPIYLNDLPRGQWRHLTDIEIRKLKEL